MTDAEGRVTSVRDLADRFHQRWLEENPLTASMYGIPGFDDLVPDESEQGQQAWRAEIVRYLEEAAAIESGPPLTAADVAELQQTTWLRLVENLHRIEQPERVGGWLATTARRESLQLLKRASKYHSGADQMLVNMPDKHLPEMRVYGGLSAAPLFWPAYGAWRQGMLVQVPLDLGRLPGRPTGRDLLGALAERYADLAETIRQAVLASKGHLSTRKIEPPSEE